LKTLGDRQGLPATVVLENNRLSIEAGEESIGDWSLDEIRLEQTPTGYRMAAEGEQLLIEMPDAAAFQSELAKTDRGMRFSLPNTEKLLKPVDKGLEAAEERWGALLPKWAFTRIMVAVIIGAALVTVFLPGLVSTFLLVSGVLMIMFGAVVYTDSMLASKWLPGRMSPMHVLLFGVVILMLGIFLGVLAR
jgi:hypothetical protein